ncbi:MAG: hypothetical protein LQ340_007172 [Diploschistes diacapsis]|nr:MAG: hypothetical protein LQ340_007172 [Diploschistes diacapsis]
MHDIGSGGNSQWNVDALPTNPDYPHALSAPKPDSHYGYPCGQRTEWTRRECAVVDHRAAIKYAQPAIGNRFPFLAVEIKWEATGGTLWQAENQAAGSGTHSVGAMQWLLEQASPSQASVMTDTIAFTIAMTARQVIVYIHYYYSGQGHACYMSFIKSYTPTDSTDVQDCRNTVKNILDDGLEKAAKLAGRK